MTNKTSTKSQKSSTLINAICALESQRVTELTTEKIDPMWPGINGSSPYFQAFSRLRTAGPENVGIALSIMYRLLHT